MSSLKEKEDKLHKLKSYVSFLEKMILRLESKSKYGKQDSLEKLKSLHKFITTTHDCSRVKMVSLERMENTLLSIHGSGSRNSKQVPSGSNSSYSRQSQNCVNAERSHSDNQTRCDQLNSTGTKWNLSLQKDNHFLNDEYRGTNAPAQSMQHSDYSDQSHYERERITFNKPESIYSRKSIPTCIASSNSSSNVLSNREKLLEDAKSPSDVSHLLPKKDRIFEGTSSSKTSHFLAKKDIILEDTDFPRVTQLPPKKDKLLEDSDLRSLVCHFTESKKSSFHQKNWRMGSAESSTDGSREEKNRLTEKLSLMLQTVKDKHPSQKSIMNTSSHNLLEPQSISNSNMHRETTSSNENLLNNSRKETQNSLNENRTGSTLVPQSPSALKQNVQSSVDYSDKCEPLTNVSSTSQVLSKLSSSFDTPASPESPQNFFDGTNANVIKTIPLEKSPVKLPPVNDVEVEAIQKALNFINAREGHKLSEDKPEPALRYEDFAPPVSDQNMYPPEMSVKDLCDNQTRPSLFGSKDIDFRGKKDVDLRELCPVPPKLLQKSRWRGTNRALSVESSKSDTDLRTLVSKFPTNNSQDIVQIPKRSESIRSRLATGADQLFKVGQQGVAATQMALYKQKRQLCEVPLNKSKDTPISKPVSVLDKLLPPDKPEPKRCLSISSNKEVDCSSVHEEEDSNASKPRRNSSESETGNSRIKEVTTTVSGSNQGCLTSVTNKSICDIPSSKELLSKPENSKSVSEVTHSNHVPRDPRIRQGQLNNCNESIKIPKKPLLPDPIEYPIHPEPRLASPRTPESPFPNNRQTPWPNSYTSQRKPFPLMAAPPFRSTDSYRSRFERPFSHARDAQWSSHESGRNFGPTGVVNPEKASLLSQNFTCLLMKGLPPYANSGHIFRFFEHYYLRDLCIVVDHRLNCKGEAYIHFPNHAIAEEALQSLQGSNIDGYPIFLGICPVGILRQAKATYEGLNIRRERNLGLPTKNPYQNGNPFYKPKPVVIPPKVVQPKPLSEDKISQPTVDAVSNPISRTEENTKNKKEIEPDGARVSFGSQSNYSSMCGVNLKSLESGGIKNFKIPKIKKPTPVQSPLPTPEQDSKEEAEDSNSDIDEPIHISKKSRRYRKIIQIIDSDSSEEEIDSKSCDDKMIVHDESCDNELSKDPAVPPHSKPAKKRGRPPSKSNLKTKFARKESCAPKPADDPNSMAEVESDCPKITRQKVSSESNAKHCVVVTIPTPEKMIVDLCAIDKNPKKRKDNLQSTVQGTDVTPESSEELNTSSESASIKIDPEIATISSDTEVSAISTDCQDLIVSNEKSQKRKKKVTKQTGRKKAKHTDEKYTTLSKEVEATDSGADSLKSISSVVDNSLDDDELPDLTQITPSISSDFVFLNTKLQTDLPKGSSQVTEKSNSDISTEQSQKEFEKIEEINKALVESTMEFTEPSRLSKLQDESSSDDECNTSLSSKVDELVLNLDSSFEDAKQSELKNFNSVSKSTESSTIESTSVEDLPAIEKSSQLVAEEAKSEDTSDCILISKPQVNGDEVEAVVDCSNKFSDSENLGVSKIIVPQQHVSGINLDASNERKSEILDATKPIKVTKLTEGMLEESTCKSSDKFNEVMQDTLVEESASAHKNNEAYVESDDDCLSIAVSSIEDDGSVAEIEGRDSKTPDSSSKIKVSTNKRKRSKSVQAIEKKRVTRGSMVVPEVSEQILWDDGGVTPLFLCDQCDYFGRQHVNHLTNFHTEKEIPCEFRKEDFGTVLRDPIGPPEPKDTDTMLDIDWIPYQLTFDEEVECQEDDCDYYSNIRFDFIYHLLEHFPSAASSVYHCRLCNFMITNLEWFYDHVASHTGEYRHSCNRCGQKAFSLGALKLHHQSYHEKQTEDFASEPMILEDNWPYMHVCKTCLHVQISKEKCEAHIEKKHHGKADVVKANLCRHIVVHSEMKKKTEYHCKNNKDGNKIEDILPKPIHEKSAANKQKSVDIDSSSDQVVKDKEVLISDSSNLLEDVDSLDEDPCDSQLSQSEEISFNDADTADSHYENSSPSDVSTSDKTHDAVPQDEVSGNSKAIEDTILESNIPVFLGREDSDSINNKKDVERLMNKLSRHQQVSRSVEETKKNILNLDNILKKIESMQDENSDGIMGEAEHSYSISTKKLERKMMSPSKEIADTANVVQEQHTLTGSPNEINTSSITDELVSTSSTKSFSGNREINLPIVPDVNSLDSEETLSACDEKETHTNTGGALAGIISKLQKHVATAESDDSSSSDPVCDNSESNSDGELVIDEDIFMSKAPLVHSQSTANIMLNGQESPVICAQNNIELNYADDVNFAEVMDEDDGCSSFLKIESVMSLNSESLPSVFMDDHEQKSSVPSSVKPSTPAPHSATSTKKRVSTKMKKTSYSIPLMGDLSDCVPILKYFTKYQTQGAFHMYIDSHSMQVFKCMTQGCVFSTNDSTSFEQHLLKHEAPQLRCCYCLLLESNVQFLVGHVLSEHSHCPFQCRHCLYRAYTKEYMYEHVKLYHPNLDSRLKEVDTIRKTPPEFQTNDHVVIVYKCSAVDCKFEAVDVDLLEVHIQKAHGDHFQLTCMFCKYVDKTDIVIEHLKAHLMNEFQCSYCMYGSSIKNYLQKHLINKHSGRPEKIIYHNSTNVTETLIEDKKETIKPTVPIKSIQKHEPKEEVENKPEIKETVELIGEELYRCRNDKCTYSCPSLVLLKEHLQICDYSRNNPYLQCYHCSKHFRHINGLLDHIRVHGPKRYICGMDQCDYRSTMAHYFRNHMKQVHHRSSYKIVAKDFSNKDPETQEYVVFPKDITSSIKEQHKKKKNEYSFEDIAKVPISHVFYQDLKCYHCHYSSKIRSNLVKHLELHKKNPSGLLTHDIDSGLSIPATQPINPVPCLDREDLMFNKMMNLAGSSNESTKDSEQRELRLKNPLSDKEIRSFPKFVPEEKRNTCGIKGCKYVSCDETMLKYHISTLHADVDTFLCPHKCKTHLDLDSISLHFKLHAETLLRCGWCSFLTTRKSLVDRHLRENHPGKPPFEYPIRDLTGAPIEQSQDTQIASTQLAPWRCGLCVFRAASQSEIVNHVSVKHETRSQYKCGFCNVKSSARGSFEAHFNSKHPNKEFTVLCIYYREDSDDVIPLPQGASKNSHEPIWKRDDPYRPKQIRGIPIETNVNLQLSNLDPGKPFQNEFVCPKCHSFKTPCINTFKLHLCKEADYQRFKCAECDLTSPLLPNIRRHYTKTHNSHFGPNCYVKLPIVPELEDWVNKVSKHQVSLMKASEDDVTEPNLKPSTSRRLSNEKTLVSSETELATLSSPKYQCSICQFECRSNSGLKSHITAVHCNKFKCNYCPFSTNLKEAVAKHVAVKHPLYKGNTSPGKQNRKKGEPKKTFNCTKCDFIAQNAKELQKHLKNHKADTFKCNHCDLKFSSESEVEVHSTKLHKDNCESEADVPPKTESTSNLKESYSCCHCSETGQLFQIEEHVKVSHRELPFLVRRSCSDGLFLEVFRYNCGHCSVDSVSLIAAMNHWMKNHVTLDFRFKIVLFTSKNIEAEGVKTEDPDQGDDEDSLKDDEVARLLQCGICNVDFTSLETLEVHLKQSHKVSKRSKLKRNASLQPKEDSPSPLKPSPTEESSTSPPTKWYFRCKCCEHTLRNKTNLRTHIRKNHVDIVDVESQIERIKEASAKPSVKKLPEENIETNQSTLYKCKYCQEILSSALQLQNHHSFYHSHLGFDGPVASTSKNIKNTARKSFPNSSRTIRQIATKSTRPSRIVRPPLTDESDLDYDDSDLFAPLKLTGYDDN